jgi:hypothetical protein
MSFDAELVVGIGQMRPGHLLLAHYHLARQLRRGMLPKCVRICVVR